MAKVGFNQYDAIVGDDTVLGSARITAQGEFQILATNRSGHVSKRGELVVNSSGWDVAYTTCPKSSNTVWGVVGTAGIAHGSPVWITFGGRAQFLLEDSSTSTRGFWIETSEITEGRAKCILAEPEQPTFSTANHDREVGHCQETVTAGTDKLAWGSIHFR